METAFQSRCNILADLWMDYRHDSQLEDFIKYNDLALPLAFMIHEGIVENIGESGKSFINEAFDLLLQALGIQDDGYETLEEMLGSVSDN